jgi:hypothetical protein
MTIRNFEYTDVDGIKKEASAYTTGSFVTTSTPDSPAITGSNGKFDASLIPSQVAAKAASLIIDRVASEQIFAGDLVYSTGTNEIGMADNSIDLDEAKVMGLALNAALQTETVEVLILGVANSIDYSVFTANDILFLDELGGITNVRPTVPDAKYLVQVGKSLGGNEILVEIKLPTVLGG